MTGAGAEAETETLAAEGVRVALGGRPVLDGVDARFRRGEVTAVLGPNGAGKSTLLACLAGLRRPDAGRVRLDGREVASLPARERARRMAVLPQSQEIAWAVDVETLVGLGRLPHLGPWGGRPGTADRAAVERALARTATVGLRTRLATNLSGGERGRVLIARALAGEPDWLLADEPLTGLDPGHQFDACDLLRAAAAEGGGVVVTLHDLSLAARVADRVLVLAGGRVAAAGPPAQALTAALLGRVYGVETQVEPGPAGLAITVLGRLGEPGGEAADAQGRTPGR